MIEEKTTDFGYQQVAPAEKSRLVRNVFTSVASEYDLMNDVMSLGIHRLWKRQAVHFCAIRKNFHVLDLAGGTGDIAHLIYKQLGADGRVTLCDINADMLEQGRDRFIDTGVIKNVGYVQGNAELLPFADNSFDCIAIAFGLRNVTDKAKALKSMHDKLKYGSQLVVLEFSKLVIPYLSKLYDRYSFKLIPLFGKLIVGDTESYQYLIESIRMHPDQTTLVNMMKEAGFSNVKYHNLSGGLVAIHRGYKL